MNDDKQREQQRKNSILIELSESERTLFGREDIEGQCAEQQVFSAIWELEGQVCMSGFKLYFWNVEGPSVNFAVPALQRIGASKCAEIVSRALTIVSFGAVEEHGARRAIVDALDDDAEAALVSLDQEFFAYPDNLTELLFRFVDAHPEVFGSVETA